MTLASYDLIYPRPRQVADGVADHTRAVAAQLVSHGHRVRILCAEQDAVVGGIEFVNAWPDGNMGHNVALTRAIAEAKPDVVVVQFEQFAYGRRGFNPQFSKVFRDIAAVSPGTARVLFAHETYVPPVSVRKSIVYTYQRWQLANLVRSADSILVTCEAWRGRIERLGRSAHIVPGPSAIPVAGGSAREARAALGMGDELAVVAFGFLDSTRCELIAAALRDPALGGATFIYAGKDTAAAVRVGAGAHQSIILASPSAAEVSRALTAADIGLAPFGDGASMRRSSLLAMLSHGLPTVSTSTDETDRYLSALAEAGALALSDVDEASFVAAVAALATSATARSMMWEALHSRVESLPTWGSVAEAIGRRDWG